MAEKLNGSTPGVGHNGPTREQFLSFLTEYQERDDAVAEAVGERKDLRKRIKGAGFDLKQFDRARQDADMSGEKRSREDALYRRYMQWLGKPVGTQGDMFTDSVPGESGDATLDVYQLKTVDNEGHAAGLRGDKIETCSYTPGTEAAARWMTAWQRGQQEKVEAMPGNVTPIAGKRGRGRPPKDQPSA